MSDYPTITVILAASPGPLRDAVHALILSLQPVKKALVLSNPVEVLIRAKEAPPQLFLIVLEPYGFWAGLAGKIRVIAPACRVAVLANGEAHQENADLVLQLGTRPDELVTALTILIHNGGA